MMWVESTTSPQNVRPLTGKQSLFVENFIRNGGDAANAAREAGYSEHVAAHATRDVLRSNAVQKAISVGLAELRERTYQKLASLAGQALDVLAQIAADTTAPATARVSACNSILDRASFARGAEAPVIDGTEQELDDILASI